MTKIIICVSLILFIAVLFWVFMLHSPVPGHGTFSLAVEELRAAASAIDGLKPDHVNVFSVAMGRFLPGFAVAGRMKKQLVPFYIYQIVYGGKNRTPVIVDTGVARDHLTGVFKNVAFNENYFNEVQNAMRRASLIVLTHEHFDHIGGLARSPYFNEIASRSLLTSEQKESPLIKDALFDTGAIEKTGTIKYDKILAVAPGVVLIKTPGHTPGHQAVYIQQSDGKEFILAGDIGWYMDNVRIPRGRPLLASIILNENRDASASQLRWLHNMENHGISVMVTHDFERTKELVRTGVLGAHLE